MTTLYVHDIKANSDNILHLPMQNIATDWFKTSSTSSPSFLLAKDDCYLHFLIEWNGAFSYDSSHQCGAFVEGLWEHDVGEMFLKDANSDRYQEFNVSPAGAWWSQSFTEYRVRDETFTSPAAKVSLRDNCTHFQIPVSELAVALNEQTTANVNFIVNNTFYTFAAPGACEPDFHRTQDFTPLTIK